MSNILIVEDSATQAAKLLAILEDDGHMVTVVGDGHQALAALAGSTFDAVISDIVMPGLSGYELCRQIKADPRIPVILLSSLDEPLDIIRGLECGADNFLTKPCPPEVLVQRLRALLENYKLRAGRRSTLGVEIAFEGLRFTISSDKEQILDLLISSFEDTIRANRELRSNRQELADAKAKLEEYAATLEAKVAKRTAELHKERAFSNLVVEHMPIGVIVKDAVTLKYILVNKAAEKIMNRPSENIIGKTCYDFLDKHVADRVSARDREAVRTRKQIVAPEELFTGPNRPEQYERIISVPVVDEEKGTGYIVTFHENVTEMRKIEQNLRHAQKLETIGQLTGGIAHDFNNLLGIILINLELLTPRVADDPEAAEMTDEAVQAAQRGSDLTKRMLAFARKQPLQPQSFNLDGTVAGMAGMLRRTLGENIELTIVPTPDLWPVVADPSQLEDVVLNLAVNARDAMPMGGRLVIETGHAQLDEAYAEQNPEVVPGEYAMLAVSDSGTGMPPEVVERAFEPFFTTKEAGRGTGLGLSMVYGFAKQSAGHLKIYSELGHGTTIKLYLPRAPSLDDRRMEAPEEPPPAAAASETILLVEDNDGLRRSTVRLLGELGYRVVVAEQGPAALEILQRPEAIDLLLTDIIMPGGMSGYQLAEIARARRPDMRILCMSAYAEHAPRNADPETPRFDLIGKPFRKQELARKLRSLLEGPS